MNLKHKVVALAIATLFAGGVFAQPTSKVTVGDINQTQGGGSGNNQTMDLGNAKGSGAKTDLTLKNVTQSQTGACKNRSPHHKGSQISW